ncbi:MAG: flagellar export chaperone FlgN [Aminobacterium sp.]
MLQDNFESKIRDLLSSEIALYTELEHYVDDELECVNNKDMEKLLEVLQQKQGVISRQELLQEEWGQIAMKFGLVEGRDGPLFWSAVEQHVESQGFYSLSKIVNEIKEQVTALLTKEEHVQALLEQHISELREQMAQLNKGKTAFKGYMKSGGVL